MSVDQKKQIDTGLSCLVIMLRFLQIPFSVENLKHRIGKMGRLAREDIIFLAKQHLKLKSNTKSVDIKKLGHLPLPVIAELKDNQFCVVTKIEQDQVFIQDPVSGQAKNYSFQQFSEIYAGSVIFISAGTDKEKGTDDSKFGFWWFLTAFFQYRSICIQIIISALVMQIFILVTPLFTMVIIDKVFSSSSRSTLEVLIIGLVIMTIFDYLVGMCRSYLLHHVSNKVDIGLVSNLFRHLTSLPMTFFSSKQTGDTISRLKEVESIRTFLTGSALTALIDFPFSLVFLFVMYFFSPLLCIVVVISISITVTMYSVISPFLKERVKKNQQGSTDTQSFLFEVVTSIETIKSLSAETRIQNAWENQLVINARNSSATENLSNHINQIAAFLNKGTVALCLWLGALSVLDGDMTAGQLIAFNMLVGRVMGPAQRIAQIFQQIQHIKVSVGRIKEIFQTKPEPALQSNRVSLPALKGEFKLDNVTFKYNPDSVPALENINLYFPAGQIVGIIGVSGSGKSTLMRLMQRLYVPTEGRILLDGINIAEINPDWFRRNIGVVLQDNLLLNRSIRENIALTDPSIDMEKIEKAAELSGADQFIRELPQVYDTIVGEWGAAISAGQRQRIALARALVNDPKIIILDEATSALDYQSEHTIHKNMRKICEGRTVFIVAHRFSTLNIANRIITLDKGKVIEDGTIAELLNQKGTFARLFAMQNLTKPKIA